MTASQEDRAALPLLIEPDWPVSARVRASITTRGNLLPHKPYSGFNVALHVGDDPAQVMAHRQALCRRLQLRRAPQWLEQVHGIRVIEAQDDDLVRTADGCFTSNAGLACAVMTADCLPVLMVNREESRVAAVHAGWRGLADGILASAVAAFDEAPDNVLVYLGPAISGAAFEVGVDVLETFFERARSTDHSEKIARAFTPGVRPLHFFADLYALARAELQALGVSNIYGGNFCTFTDDERFYSYRRDGVTGRMASLIWLQDVD